MYRSFSFSVLKDVSDIKSFQKNTQSRKTNKQKKQQQFSRYQVHFSYHFSLGYTFFDNFVQGYADLDFIKYSYKLPEAD